METIYLLWTLVLLVDTIFIVLAVAGIFLVAFGRLRLALVLAAPALLFSLIANAIAILFWLTYVAPPGYPGAAEAEERHVVLNGWFFTGGVPLALGLFVAFLAWFHRDTPRKSPHLVGLFYTVFTFVFMAVFAVKAMITFTAPKVYFSAAQIRVSRDSGFSLAPDRDFVYAACRIITSTNILQPVVANLDLNNIWGKKYNNGAPFKTWDTVKILRARLAVSPVRDTAMIHIAIYTDDPYDAAQIANAIAKAYRDYRTIGIDTDPSLARHPVVEIVDPAKPMLTPIRPKKALDTAFGAVLGMIIAAFMGGLVILFTDIESRNAHVSKPILGNPQF